MRLSIRTATKCRHFQAAGPKRGDIEEKVMYNTYNMGIGMVIGVSPEDAGRALEL